MILISNKKGTSLIETLLAFSLFITCVIMLVSLYTLGYQNMSDLHQQYQYYYQQQKEREENIWQEGNLETQINKVLH